MFFLQRLFGPKIDPNTVVEIWKFFVVEDDGKDFASLAKSEISSWSHYEKYLLEILDIPHRVYGLEEPMIVVIAVIYGKTICMHFTKKDFQEKLGKMTIHTPEEQAEYIQYFIKKYELAILKAEGKKLELEIEILTMMLEKLQENQLQDSADE